MASINQNIPHLKTGSTRNQRDTVYKTYQQFDNSFYTLYDFIIATLKGLSTHADNEWVRREFEKIKSKCKTIITLFFEPSLELLANSSDYQSIVNKQKTSLKNNHHKLALVHYRIEPIQKEPRPKDPQMLDYIAEFLNHLDPIVVKLGSSETKPKQFDPIKTKSVKFLGNQLLHALNKVGSAFKHNIRRKHLISFVDDKIGYGS